jgi:hypothetical protein
MSLNDERASRGTVHCETIVAKTRQCRTRQGIGCEQREPFVVYHPIMRMNVVPVFVPVAGTLRGSADSRDV